MCYNLDKGEMQMSTRERYIKVIESLVNGEEAKASDLLHEAFVEKAREIWNDLVEADEVIEDEVAEEDIDEAIGGEKADDFIDDIEEDDDEIEAEQMYGEDEEGDEAPEDELADADAEMELSGEEGDYDMDGETDEHEGDHEELEDKLVNVEDALADLKAEFAKIMGDEAPAEDEVEMGMEPEMDMDMEAEPEMEEAMYEETDADDDAEELEEAAELSSVGNVAIPAGDDGKSSPTAGKNDMGGKAVDMSAKSADGKSNGLTGDAKDMKVTHPGDGAKLSAETKGHGAEKKGKAE